MPDAKALHYGELMEMGCDEDNRLLSVETASDVLEREIQRLTERVDAVVKRTAVVGGGGDTIRLALHG